MAETRKCSPNCEFFRCSQKALQFRSGKAYCRFADDVCEGYTCKYAFCIRNRLLPDGVCGLTLKRTTTSIETPPEEVIKGIKVKGKLQKKIREKEIF